VQPRSTVAWDRLCSTLVELRARALELEERHAFAITSTHPAFRASARNLVHYLSLRQHDLRAVQSDLAELGLSSLGRSEPHVLQSLDAVISVLNSLLGRTQHHAVLDTPSAESSTGWNVAMVGGALAWVGPSSDPPAAFDGWALLDAHTDALLGPPSAHRRVRIMVTLSSEAASDASLVREILRAGAESVRINCAHDDSVAWSRMVAHVRVAERELKTECRILIDLAGPKLRTGAVTPGPRVVHWLPKRDAVGSVVRPARVLLTADIGAVPPSSDFDVSLPVPASGWPACTSATS
jgi:pyruvate kinase